MINLEDWVFVGNSWLNAFLAGLMAYEAILTIKRVGYPRPFSMGLAIIGMYWCGLYVYVGLAGMGATPGLDPVWFGRIFVRPAFTVTLAIMATIAIHRRSKRNGTRD